MDKKYREKAEKAVARGVAFLNGFHPDWQMEIDLKSLDLGGCHRCILAQLFGSYHNGLRLFSTSFGNLNTKAVKLGFVRNLTMVESLAVINYEYEVLTEIWRKHIEEYRQHARQVETLNQAKFPEYA